MSQMEPRSPTDALATPNVSGLQYPRVGGWSETSEMGYPDTINDVLAFGVLDPTVSISPHSYSDVLAVIFSHLSFIERVFAAPVCRAFYTAYRKFIDHGPLLRLVLAGDYMNVARVINKLSRTEIDVLSSSTTFAILMFLGGMPMVSLMNSLGGCDAQLSREVRHIINARYHFTTRWYGCNGRARVHKRTSHSGRGPRSPSPDLEPYDPEELVIGRRYDLLERDLAEIHGYVAPATAYPAQVQTSIECMLPVFHNRCVPSTPLCMRHQTHICLPTDIPQIIIDIHARNCMNLRLLAVCIYAARVAHNAGDEIWLQNRYPNLYWHAVAMPLRIQDIPRIDCNMKNAGNLNDTFVILKLYDELGATRDSDPHRAG